MLRLLLTVFALTGTVILLWDVGMSYASMQFGFEYSRAAFGTFVIHALAGFFVCRYGNLALSPLIGAALGLLDSTLGWYLSWMIQYGHVDDVSGPTVEPIISVVPIIIFVTLWGAAESFLGGLLGLINKPVRV